MKNEDIFYRQGGRGRRERKRGHEREDGGRVKVEGKEEREEKRRGE